METMITLALAFFASQKFIRPHINLAVAVFVAVWVALTIVDIKQLGFYAGLILKLIIFAVVMLGLHMFATP